jgi:asparagine synthase (glutamine-hydrolysing)
MCGFAGVVTWDDRYRVSPETLKRMSAAIAHRGPDGEGFHINHQDQVTPDRPQVALAFRRLAIVDPDPRSNQPFTDGRHWLVFNGEIYNFRDLRKELSGLRPDYQWRTTGDTEVLLCAYAVWGEKCVEKLNGMFAFAVWDEVEKSLFLARDRMGQKPLYFAAPPGGRVARGSAVPALAIASELSAFHSIPWFDKTIHLESVTEYLRWGYLPAGRTIYSWAFSFAPAGWWLFAKGNWKAGETYFGPNREDAPSTNATKQTGDLLTRAVGRQLVSDVPLGCFLSGGVDSSIVAAAMKKCVSADQQVLTFAIGFDDPRYDETEYAAQVAAHLGTTHRRFVVRTNAAEDLPKIAAAFAEPFGDSSALPTHYLSREVRNYVKVALSGDGGDELFGGYDRYRAILFERTLRFVPPFIRKALAVISVASLKSVHPKSRSARVRRFLQSLDRAVGERYAGYVRLFDEILIDQLWSNARRSDVTKFENWLAKRNIVLPDTSMQAQYSRLLVDRDPVQAALALDRMTYLPNDLLTKVDRCSMMHGLEVRSPFMDHELVQFAAGLTTDQLLKGGPKRMLREAFKDDLPPWVFKRKKMGFAVPIGDWFRGELRPMLRDTLFSSHAFGRTHFDMKVVERLVEEHETKRVDHSQRLYALLMLELWWNTTLQT